MAQTGALKHIVVIGAGAAGLKAASDLLEQNFKVTLVEARPRLGGRAYTEMLDAFPFDQGALGLQDMEKNPFVKIAEQYGLAPVEWSPENFVFLREQNAINGRLDQKEANKLFDTYDGIGSAVKNAGKEKKDMSVEDAVKLYNPSLSDNPYFPMAKGAYGPLEETIEVKSFSAFDKSRASEEGSTVLCKGGYGNLVTRYGNTLLKRFTGNGGILTLLLNTAAKTVNVLTGGVLIDVSAQSKEGKSESIKADAVIVTVPTSIITTSNLTFVPSLPPEVQKAFQKLPLGYYEKVALEFKANIFSGLPGWQNPADQSDGAYSVVWPQAADEKQVWKFQIGLHKNENIVIGYIGGTTALNLLTQDRDADGRNAALMEIAKLLDGQSVPKLPGDRGIVLVAAALNQLQAIVGPDILKALFTGRASVSNWGNDPWSLGAYSYTLPGEAQSDPRSFLANVDLEGSIFFAGEALFQDAYATVHGAYASGAYAAQRVLKRFSI